MHEVLDDLFTAAVLQEFGPGRPDPHTLLIVVDQRVIMQVERRAHVDVEPWQADEYYQYDYCIQAGGDDGAFSKAEVPYRLAEVIWQAEAAFFTHSLQATTASMHCILGQEEDDRCNDESQKAKDDESSETDQWEKLIDLVLHISDNLDTAELTYFFHWPSWHDSEINHQSKCDNQINLPPSPPISWTTTYSISKYSWLSDVTARDVAAFLRRSGFFIGPTGISSSLNSKEFSSSNSIVSSSFLLLISKTAWRKYYNYYLIIRKIIS